MLKLPPDSVLDDLLDQAGDLVIMLDDLGIQSVAHRHESMSMKHVIEVERIPALSSY